MISGAVDYYEVLGVDRGADASAIKRSYLMLIREYTPESAPERFQQISEAYAVLSNAEKRSAYDREEHLPPAVQKAVSRVMKLAEEDAPRAVEMALSLVRDHPEFDVLRSTYGIALLHADRPGNAAAEFEHLLVRDPEHAPYARLLGQALIAAGREDEGIRYIKQAILLDKENSSAYITLARHYMQRDQDDSALAVLDRGIQADGKIDAQDLPLFMERILIFTKERNWDRMEQTVRRLLAVIPEDDGDARSYAAWQFVGLAHLFDELELPHLTKFALDASLRMDPNQESVRNLASSMEKPASYFREREEFADQSDPQRWTCAFVWALRELDDEDEDRRQQVLAAIAVEIAQNPGAARWQWRQLSQRYPIYCGGLTPAFEALTKSVEQTRASHSAAASSEASSEGGCGWLIAVVVGLWLLGRIFG